jgi:hypothetical protein
MRASRASISAIVLALALAVGYLGWSSWQSVAVRLAPRKAQSQRQRPDARVANANFWKAFHAGEYERIPQVLNELTAASLRDPYDAQTAAHIGFLHTWLVNESARNRSVPATITDHVILARKYFAEASELAPADERYKGFLAGMELAEASQHADESLRRRGYFDLLHAVDGWPEFNLFTAGYILSRLSYADPKFAEGVAFEWRNLDACAGGKVDRQSADYAPYMSRRTVTGPRRVCWNSWIAPHNFEGFFLNFGDMLVKQGSPGVARHVYADAKLIESYPTWPFRSVLEQRIVQADDNVERFRHSTENDGTHAIMIASRFACMACHQD